MIARISILTIALTVQTAFAQSAPANKPDLAKAKQTAETVCAACHGADGNSIAATFPKLAGQHEAYLAKQLSEFKSQGGKPALRINASMAPMVAALSDADMRGLAAYFSQQKQKPEQAKNKQTVEFGQKLWRAGDASKGLPACSGCHGPAGMGIPAQYPRLQGQYADYIEAQLKAFRANERNNDPASMMRTVAIRMTDAEIKAVSDYAAGLR
ncbi:c-type cytochrome [Uliginosibacterium sp. 31-16]|uniref:c-type cytochrome n=1 Tax=Uliginosibacterium sp. 31-16 TaxID=3068315 RepID=UPI00273F6661|nr:c-type cytochrome [Uliginosibacterium sp. 31-16]MDP5240744.1 c-type cytochrome [Uliginosibacterium sp. 31-16]